MNIALLNEATIPAADFKAITDAVTWYFNQVIPVWKTDSTPTAVSNTAAPGDWIIHVTDNKRKPGAGGYHLVENGVPTAYCSPIRNPFGLFGKVTKALLNWKTKQVVTPSKVYNGLVTTICHEMAEMIADPMIKSISPVDANGKTWLIEVCDHAFGSTKEMTFDNQVCVLPDMTTPAFYSLTAPGPFSIFGGVSNRFTLSGKAYGYEVVKGKFVALPANYSGASKK